MNILASFQQAVAGSVKGVKIGACLIMVGLAGMVGSAAQAQASGTATANLTLSLTVSSTNPSSCSVGSISPSSSSSQTYNLVNGAALYLAGSYTAANGFPVYCSSTFTVSANDGLAGGGYADSELTRYLFLGGSSAAVNKYQYGLVLGGTPSGVAGTAAYPTWSGSNATSCTTAFTGAAAVSAVSSGGTASGTAYGCYKSTTIASATAVYIPWGYYVSAPSGWINTGTFTDIVALTLNY